jgi:hypothetical protein
MIYFKYDNNGFFVEAIHENYIERDLDGQLILDNITDIPLPNGLYKGRFVNTEWIETGGAPQIDINVLRERTLEELTMIKVH